MNKIIKKNAEYWFYPVEDFVYDASYIKKYKKYAKTFKGKQLLKARLKILIPYTKIVDVGVGSEDLINHKPKAEGYDVNPIAIQKLKIKKRWVDIYKDSLDNFDAICFFDSFEHIEKPENILKRIKKSKIIMSIPIFYNYEHILNSRHFRPNEHYHYFTFLGLLNYMKKFEFECIYVSDIEISIGRNDIFTFIFQKR